VYSPLRGADELVDALRTECFQPDTDGFGELLLDELKLALAVQIFYTTMVPDYYRAFQRFSFAC
jgi:hypothetical protein